MVVGTFNELLVHAKSDVFCVEVALQSLHVAYEAYYDPDGTPTLSGSGPTNLEVGGFTYVDCIYNSDMETFCLIAYHQETSCRAFVAQGLVVTGKVILITAR